ncbi:RNA-binding cell elongation regulator Jag/EloR [Thermodesulfitimonas sp.]
MREVVKSGKTVEEAVAQALATLGARRDEVTVEVLSEPTQGVLGFIGAKPAVVRVIIQEGAGSRAAALVQSILSALGLNGQVNVREDAEAIEIEITGEKLGVLIGRRGETLNALQYLVALAVNRGEEEKKRVFVDVGGYRKKRDETLRALALKLAEKVKRRGRSIVLEPMSPHERRIIHMTLRERDDIYTFSEGEEPFRKIVISPRK